jgi:hypothetical protein
MLSVCYKLFAAGTYLVTGKVKTKISAIRVIHFGLKGGYKMKYSNRIIMIFFAITALAAFSGCGGGSGGGQSAGVTVPSTPSATTSTYQLSEDSYGLQNATFMSATNSNGSFVMRAAIAESMTDPSFTSVFRIDVVQPQLISGPGTYVVGTANSPVVILFPNGHRSFLLNTVSGSITFTSYGVHTGDVVAGNFQVMVEDQNFNDDPRPTYPVSGNFSFVVNTSGALVPTPVPVPAGAAGSYDAKCASCHALGSYDTTSTENSPDLALHGGNIPDHFTAGVPGHNGITLTAQEIHDLKILLNAN